ncbi:MAG: HipA domain-containing protein [bacterium]|nr:HipA domain-containing protein [bacterium]
MDTNFWLAAPLIHELKIHESTFMNTCEFEIHIDGQWRECCTIEIDKPALGGTGASRITYDSEFVHNYKNSPASLRIPVSRNSTHLDRWPSFLFDLIPQGKGRKYLLGELNLQDGPSADWQLLCAGAINPIGRLRVRESARFYEVHPERQDELTKRGFKLQDILERKDEFLENIFGHNMLTAGTTGLQGVAPKFMLTLGKDDLFYLDGAIPDAHAKKHYLVKLSRGRDPSDLKILKNEAAFMRTTKALGLAVDELPEWHADMLFIPRFDRLVTESGIERRHQESGASLVGQIGFDQRPSQNDLLAAIRLHVTDKTAATIEFIKRDVLNLAMGNTDNHARNTAVQIVNGRVQLTPLFDFAPMNLDKEGIARALRWKRGKTEITNWADVLASLELDPDELATVTDALRIFGSKIEGLSDVMAEQGVDSDIIGARYYAIQNQINQLKELRR